jgi:hypothetical protein
VFARDLRTHEGISVRVSAGIGFGSTRHKLSKGSYRVRGLLGGISLDVGTSVRENLIVYGRLAGYGWNTALESDTDYAGGAFLGLVGAGARYYLMPANAFASATLGLAATQVLGERGESQNAHPGFGFDLELGKDFWAGTPLDRRAIGLSLRFSYITCGAAGTGQKDPKAWNSWGLGLVFSAGYN